MYTGSDFDPIEETVVFNPSAAFEAIQVDIPIINDAINEADEGFLVILELTSDPGSVNIIRHDTLVKIRDNDRKLNSHVLNTIHPIAPV